MKCSGSGVEYFVVRFEVVFTRSTWLSHSSVFCFLSLRMLSEAGLTLCVNRFPAHFSPTCSAALVVNSSLNIT